MNKLINNAIIQMINEKDFSINRINDIIKIKVFIDNISKKDYIPLKEAEKLEEKYGVKPNIVTWGDYFQTEMAASLQDLSDEEFSSAVDTVKFDIISSWNIFSNKDSDFFEWVENTYNKIMKMGFKEHTNEEEQIIHLKILKDYYINLEIESNFSESILEWYHSFEEALAI